MLRYSRPWWNVTRTWTKSAISGSAAHFPDAVRVDPATLRTSGSRSAKEGRHWAFVESTAATKGKAVRPLWQPVEQLVGAVRLYGDAVRFSRPAGWQLLLIPCYWGASLAVTRALVFEGADPVVLCAPFIPVNLLFLFFAGAYLMRSAGCVINDLCDRKFDRMVERTKDRPLAAGRLPVSAAVSIIVSHGLLGLVVAMNLSPAALLSALAVVPLAAVYPLMKRYTYFPQAVLGLCYSWGIFVGYAAVLGHVDWVVCLPMYLASVVWVMLYDTIYGFQDVHDDVKCGVKGMAIVVGHRKFILHLMVPLIGIGILVSGALSAQSLPFYAGVGASIYYLYAIVDHLNIYDHASCASAFKAQVRVGLYIWLSLICSNLLWAIAAAYARTADEAGEVTTSAVPATGTDATSDAATAVQSSPLQKFLLVNQSVEPRVYDSRSFTWLDRLLHPAVVYAEVAKAQGTGEVPPIPAWMRREYGIQNVGFLLRLLCVPETTIEAWSMSLYAMVDHYTFMPTVRL